ncbi:MAG TPA: hypothetical protein VH280_01820, partial [Verrucomicrobiae bacterium]|jgi:hypothetical protein|nr:hypothetical protein [Verrucomicrobiae bacterium]
MKKKSTSKSAFFNLRVLIAAVLCLAGIFVALLGIGAFSNLFAQTKGTNQSGAATRQDAPGTQTPNVVRMVGPVRLDQDLRTLPYIPNETEEGPRLTRHPFPLSGGPESSRTSAFPQFQALLGKVLTPTPNMPVPLLTFDGTDRVGSGCNCRPPDTIGDVGPNHYVQGVNSGFRVFDKSGNPLIPFITFNSFFASLGTGNPCGNNQNGGDIFVFYDQVADRWVLTDLGFASFPGPGPFYECIGVSQTPDPTGGYFLYALLVDPVNLDDYPKLALWNNPQPGGAYFLTVNLFNGMSQNFEGVSVFALDRGSMLTGGPTHAISFMIPPAGLGDSYSLVAANFRTGAPPPAGRDEMLLAVDSDGPGAVLTQVKGWLFHVDFVTPGNSTLGVGLNHAPNALITVNPFVDAFTNTTSNIVPQQGGQPPLDTLGDKIMTPVVYQNRSGTESLWADQTIILNYPNGPTAVRWYQFNVTGGTFPATPVQQQDWSNGNDGLFRWMPAIAVDQNGNTAIGYSTSSANDFPSIRYAGRFASDPPGDLGQGEAILFSGTGSQTSASGRWGDYSMTTLDTDGLTFWHTNEYYATTGSSWNTRVGKFQFPPVVVRSSPIPRPRPTPPPRP